MVFKWILTFKIHFLLINFTIIFNLIVYVMTPWSRIQKYARIGSLFCFCFVGFIFFFL